MWERGEVATNTLLLSWQRVSELLNTRLQSCEPAACLPRAMAEMGRHVWHLQCAVPKRATAKFPGVHRSGDTGKELQQLLGKH